ncbi:hypothetical protein AB7Y93_20780 [Providencia manganoxydans]|uniref:hypothetical protein n=1 Tax=Providencia manganoxydans TaxID=2923283 RepID=UPI0028103DFB|nr:hypothetical protein [Providencia stuartii]ELR5084459.1 hypothetical protein [Providencia stuartii]
MNVKFLFVLLASFIALGCNDNMPPKCDSQETKALLNKVIKNSFNNLGVTGVTHTVTGHDLVEKHEKAKEYLCEARVVLHASNGRMTSEVINYSVFLDENKKGQFFVQIED